MTQLISKQDQYLRRILRKRAFHKQNGLCHWCGQPMLEDASLDDPMACSADEVIPIHAGGRVRPGNVVAAHRKCNNERHPEMNQSPLVRQK